MGKGAIIEGDWQWFLCIDFTKEIAKNAEYFENIVGDFLKSISVKFKIQYGT